MTDTFNPYTPGSHITRLTNLTFHELGEILTVPPLPGTVTDYSQARVFKQQNPNVEYAWTCVVPAMDKAARFKGKKTSLEKIKGPKHSSTTSRNWNSLLMAFTLTDWFPQAPPLKIASTNSLALWSYSSRRIQTGRTHILLVTSNSLKTALMPFL